MGRGRIIVDAELWQNGQEEIIEVCCLTDITTARTALTPEDQRIIVTASSPYFGATHKGENPLFEPIMRYADGVVELVRMDLVKEGVVSD